MTELRLQDAVPLGYALVSRVARDSGVRALGIKGPIATGQGLRAADHESVDVDVWLDPRGVERFRRRLVQLGWHIRVEPTSAQIMPLHSFSYAHEKWPCEIDVHDRYPGFLAEPQLVFDEVWSRAGVAVIAETAVPSVDRVSSSAIQALHLIRDYGPDDQQVAAFADRLSVVLTSAELEGLVELAELTGARTTLAPCLNRLGVGVPPGSDDEFRQELAAWRVSTTSPAAKAVPALYELTREPLRKWPRLLLRSLLLTEDEIRDRQPHARAGALGLAAARIRRVGWGLRALPHALATIWRERRR